MENKNKNTNDAIQIEGFDDSLPRVDFGHYRDTILVLIPEILRARVTNLGVVGPYGSGKSSLLLSTEAAFNGADDRCKQEIEKNKERLLELNEKTRKVKSFTFISISAWVNPLHHVQSPAQGTKNENDKGEKPPLSVLESNIAQQLLHSEKPSKLPFSRLKRLGRKRRYAWAWVFFILAAMLITAGAIMMPTHDTFGYPIYLFDALAQNPWIPGLTLSVGVAMAVLALLLVISVLGLKRFSVGWKNTNLEVSSPSETLNFQFDDCLEELVYFFIKSKRNVIVFEDLDRVDLCFEIVADLRALNEVLNACPQIKKRGGVLFIYCVGELSDESKRLSTVAGLDKVFDFYVNVTPIFNHYNSLDMLFDEYAGKVDKVCLVRMAKHITDKRKAIAVHNAFLNITAISKGVELSKQDYGIIFCLAVYHVVRPDRYSLLIRYDSSCPLLARMRSEMVAGVDYGLETDILEASGIDVSFYKYLVPFERKAFDSRSDRAFYDLVRNGDANASLQDLKLDNPKTLFDYLTMSDCQKASVLNPYLFYASGAYESEFRGVEKELPKGISDKISSLGGLSRMVPKKYEECWSKVFGMGENQAEMALRSKLVIPVIESMSHNELLLANPRLLLSLLSVPETAKVVFNGPHLKPYMDAMLDVPDPSLLLDVLNESQREVLLNNQVVFRKIRSLSKPELFKPFAEKGLFVPTSEGAAVVFKELYEVEMEEGRLFATLCRIEDKSFVEAVAKRAIGHDGRPDEAAWQNDDLESASACVQAGIVNAPFVNLYLPKMTRGAQYQLDGSEVGVNTYVEGIRKRLFKAYLPTLRVAWALPSKSPYAPLTENQVETNTIIYRTLMEDCVSVKDDQLDGSTIPLVDAAISSNGATISGVASLASHSAVQPRPFSDPMSRARVIGLLKAGKLTSLSVAISKYQGDSEFEAALLSRPANEYLGVLPKDLSLSLLRQILDKLENEDHILGVLSKYENVIFTDDGYDLVQPYLPALEVQSFGSVLFVLGRKDLPLDEKYQFVLRQNLVPTRMDVLSAYDHLNAGHSAVMRNGGSFEYSVRGNERRFLERFASTLQITIDGANGKYALCRPK